MSRVFSSALVAFLLAGCGNSDLPARALCNGAPAEATITDLAIGTARVGFRPLDDGAPTYTEVDGEGRTLISIRAGWRGAEAPECGRVTFFVFDPTDGEELLNETLQLDSVALGDWFTSGPVFFDATDWPADVVIELRIYGMVLRQTHPVGGWEATDAGF